MATQDKTHFGPQRLPTRHASRARDGTVQAQGPAQCRASRPVRATRTVPSIRSESGPRTAASFPWSAHGEELEKCLSTLACLRYVAISGGCAPDSGTGGRTRDDAPCENAGASDLVAGGNWCMRRVVPTVEPNVAAASHPLSPAPRTGPARRNTLGELLQPFPLRVHGYAGRRDASGPRHGAARTASAPRVKLTCGVRVSVSSSEPR